MVRANRLLYWEENRERKPLYLNQEKSRTEPRAARRGKNGQGILQTHGPGFKWHGTGRIQGVPAFVAPGKGVRGGSRSDPHTPQGDAQAQTARGAL